MKLEQICELWEKDSQIDKSDLANESLKVPKLHNKYYIIFIQERAVLFKLNQDLSELHKVKIEYYLGKLSQEELKTRQWQPVQLRIIKSDLEPYIEADKDLNELKLKISFQSEKVDFLESIIKTLTNRNFAIKNAIDFIKFENGID